MPIQRLNIQSEGGEPLWVEADPAGEYVRWEDVEKFVKKPEGEEPMSESEFEAGVKWQPVQKLIADYEGWELTVEPAESNGWRWTAVWYGEGGRETRTVSWYAATRRQAQQDAVAAVDLRNR